MYQSDSIAELSEALAKAQGEICHAKKDEANPFFKSKYADLASVIDAARASLSKNGLSVVQATNMMDNGGFYLVTQLNHASGQWMRSSYPIKPVKDDPQGIGSALTYARRYAYASLVGVAAAGDDDDGNAASGNGVAANDKLAKAVFSTAGARKTYCDNAIKTLEGAETVKELNEKFTLEIPKLNEMKASGNEHDLLGAEEVHKRYQARLKLLKDEEIHQQQQDDTKARA